MSVCCSVRLPCERQWQHLTPKNLSGNNRWLSTPHKAPTSSSLNYATSLISLLRPAGAPACFMLPCHARAAVTFAQCRPCCPAAHAPMAFKRASAAAAILARMSSAPVGAGAALSPPSFCPVPAPPWPALSAKLPKDTAAAVPV
jgi:hypothetical protein